MLPGPPRPVTLKSHLQPTHSPFFIIIYSVNNSAGSVLSVTSHSNLACSYIYTMTDVKLEGFGETAVPTKLPLNITKAQLEDFPAFKTWKAALKENLDQQYTDPEHAFHEDPYTLRSIDVQSVDWFGSNIDFVKHKATIQANKLDDKGKPRKKPNKTNQKNKNKTNKKNKQPKNSQDER